MYFDDNKNNVLAVDHGNYAVKTPDDFFKSGLREDPVAPAMGEDYISYKDGKWILSDSGPSYSRTKTDSENLFVLTLFAAAREAKKGLLDIRKPVTLAIGLPPMHLRTERRDVERYFKERSGAKLVYDGERGVPFFIAEIKIYPQGLSAITFAKYAAQNKLINDPEYIDFPSLLIVDIGGGTADTIYIREGKPEPSLCKSYELGTNFLMETIMNDLSMNMAVNISARIIEDILMGRKNIYTIDPDDENSKKVLSLIGKAKRNHVRQLLSKINMDIPEAKSVPCIFEGGGSELLKKEISSDTNSLYRSRYYEFLTDAHYNACGYRLLADYQLGGEHV